MPTKLQPNRKLAGEISYLLQESQQVGRKVLLAVLQVIKDALLRGEKVYIRGFGTFRVVERTPKRTSKFIVVSDGWRNPVAVSEAVVQHRRRSYVIFEPSLPLMAMMNLDSPNYKERRTQRLWSTSA